MPTIQEAYILNTDNSDILKSPSRLAGMPYDGEMLVEATAQECNAQNYWAFTIQEPTAQNPLEDVIIPANGYSTTDNVLHNETEFTYQTIGLTGGHLTLGAQKVGEPGELFVRCSLTGGDD